jgi:ribosomal protein L11 methyltransferase
MSWLQITLEVAAEQAEQWSDALFELGALSVSLEDAWAGTAAEQPIFGEPGSPAEQLWARSRVVALLAADTDVAALLSAASEALATPCPSVQTEVVEEQDWVRATQAQFDPIRISERLWITPSWHQPPDQGAVNLQLDPGLAFGTGSHPTTRLCLRWLDAHLPATHTVLDYGCGSGILAIAAKKLGAGPTIGVDIDPQAMIASRQNADINQVDVQFFLPDDAPLGRYQVVVANILANPLKVLAPMLAEATQPGGHIVLSGILAEQADSVMAVYAPWFRLEAPDEEDGWVCLTGVRHDVAPAG